MKNKYKIEKIRLSLFHKMNCCKIINIQDEISNAYDRAEERFDNIHNSLYKFYNEQFEAVLDFMDIANISYLYLFDNDLNEYYDFIISYFDFDYDLYNLSDDDKKEYGILSCYLMLKQGIPLYKSDFENLYGCKLSSTQFNNLKKRIESCTNYKIITRSNLSYVFEEQKELDEEEEDDEWI